MKCHVQRSSIALCTTARSRNIPKAAFLDSLLTTLVFCRASVSNNAVETLGPSQRRIALMATVVVALAVSTLLGFSFLTRPKTDFEKEHAHAVMRNPRWLRIEIATSDGRREYREDEGVPIVVHFSSMAPHMYKADAADGVSISAASDLLHISNGEKRPRNYMMGVVCCDSRLIGLDDEPFTPPFRTPLTLPPGDYEIYLTSRRVFHWDGDGVFSCCGPSPFEVASNILKIRVVPGLRAAPDPGDLLHSFPIPLNP